MTSETRPSREDVERVLPLFTGSIEQVPPTYSALKIDGRAAYKRARAGEELELKSRTVTVFELQLLESSPDSVTLSATVSKGTYVRSLARDIARAVGTVGHIAHLRRTRAGPFAIERAISLDFLEQAAKARQLDGAVVPLQAALDDIPALPVTPDQARLLRHGQKLVGIPAQPGLCVAMLGETPVALVEATVDGLKVVRGFNL
jgi:tRNA pseudouridine55 synthase